MVMLGQFVCPAVSMVTTSKTGGLEKTPLAPSDNLNSIKGVFRIIFLRWINDGKKIYYNLRPRTSENKIDDFQRFPSWGF